jgi:membrane protease YdiL (CAAX protease family)
VTNEDSTFAQPETSVAASQPLIPLKERPADPDNPPWGVLAAFLTWMGSVLLLWLVPQLCALPYLAAHYRGQQAPTTATLLSDPKFVLILVLGFVPAHLLTLLIAWAIASRAGKLRARSTLGFSWPANFGAFKSISVAFLLFVGAMLIIYKFGGQDTEIERILRSSRGAAIVTAIVAAVTAPLVEEIIYRGILYSALRRATGAIAAVAIVASLFAGLHVLQYWPNFGAISVISLLSLTLTIIRARTGRLLPCYVIHLVFNSIQSILIVADPYLHALFQMIQHDARILPSITLLVTWTVK